MEHDAVSHLGDEIRRDYERNNRLHSVVFEVTHHCMCRCGHCYVSRNTENELTVDEISSLFTQFRDEGVFNLALTGGEPFMRGDFPMVLELARKHRFFTNVLTNGILLNKPEIKLLQDNNVAHVQLSLLGAGPGTHDRLAGYPGAFHKTMRAARLLLEARISMHVTVTIFRQNLRELDAVKVLGRKMGVPLTLNYLLAPRFDGDLSPLRSALTESEVARIDPGSVQNNLTGFHRETDSGARLTCSAGRTFAGVSPQGDVYPCVVLRRRVGNIRERSLQRIWHDDTDPFLRELRALKPEDVRACAGCEYRPYCRRCPGVAYLETGSVRSPSPSSCAHARGAALARIARENAVNAPSGETRRLPSGSE